MDLLLRDFGQTNGTKDRYMHKHWLHFIHC
jgi:hypothetical protein